MEPICEKDYQIRIANTCQACNNYLEGSFITSNGKKYHPEHFVCSKCKVSFGTNDEYHENHGELLCPKHYSLSMAHKCSGCLTSITGKFVENNKENKNQKWHPECYMIHKFWNIKLSLVDPEDETPDLDLPEIVDNNIELKAQQIWSILSSYEESSASCISDLLVCMSNFSFNEGILLAEKFVMHIEILFNAISHIENGLNKYKDNLELKNEPKILVDKILGLFQLLRQVRANNSNASVTQSLLSFVTGVAHYLKNLIRLTLLGALKMEKNYKEKSYVSRLLKMLILHKDNKRAEQWRILVKMEAKHSSDQCHTCHTKINSECIKINHIRVHELCLFCNNCQQQIKIEKGKITINKDSLIHCSDCPRLETTPKVKKVSKFDQYAYLLRLSLKELSKYLSTGFEVLKHKSKAQSKNRLSDIMQNMNRDSTSTSLPSKERFAQPITRCNSEEALKPSNLKEKPTNKKSPYLDINNENVTSIRNLSMIKLRTKNVAPKSILNESLFKVEDLKLKPAVEYDLKGKDTSYLSEMSVLECFIIKHIAAISLHKYIGELYSKEDIFSLIGSKKASNLWNKFKIGLKPNFKKIDNKVFGVPLYILSEKKGIVAPCGINKNHLRVPIFFHHMIVSLEKMSIKFEHRHYC